MLNLRGRRRLAIVVLALLLAGCGHSQTSVQAQGPNTSVSVVEIARQAARSMGEGSPQTIEWVDTTRARAADVEGGCG